MAAAAAAFFFFFAAAWGRPSAPSIEERPFDDHSSTPSPELLRQHSPTTIRRQTVVPCPRTDSPTKRKSFALFLISKVTPVDVPFFEDF